MICYHTTLKDRIESILKEGLLPNSKPAWFTTRTPYIMLCLRPWYKLNGYASVVLEVNDPKIKKEHFVKTDMLRWPSIIDPKFIKIKEK